VHRFPHQTRQYASLAECETGFSYKGRFGHECQPSCRALANSPNARTEGATTLGPLRADVERPYCLEGRCERKAELVCSPLDASPAVVDPDCPSEGHCSQSARPEQMLSSRRAGAPLIP